MESIPKPTKRRADRWSVLFLIVMLAGWVAAAWFLSLAMRAGYNGLTHADETLAAVRDRRVVADPDERAVVLKDGGVDGAAVPVHEIG